MSSEESLPAPNCSLHPEAPALYRCDGCGLHLCAECVEPRTHIVLCASCGELAVPLPADLAEEEPEPAPAALPLETRAGLVDLLRYPLHGRQGVLFWILSVLLTGVAALTGTSNELGCVALLPFALLVVLFPGLLADVTRTAAAGLGDLLEWPDYRSPGGRARELLLYFLVSGLALVPVSALLAGLGCGDRIADGRGLGAGCIAVLGVALWPSALLWMSLWPVAATSGSLVAALAPRDLLRRFVRAPHAAVVAATVGWGALLLGPALRSLLPRGSVAGMIAEAIPGAWGAIVGARAAGLLLFQAGDQGAATSTAA